MTKVAVAGELHSSNALPFGGGRSSKFPSSVVIKKRKTPSELRQAALVLKASRRFRYTLDLKKEEERKQLVTKIRTDAQVIRAAVLFQAAGQGINVPGDSKLPSTPTRVGNFGLSTEELVSFSREHDISLLQRSGVVKGVAEKLKSDLEKLKATESQVKVVEGRGLGSSEPLDEAPPQSKVAEDLCATISKYRISNDGKVIKYLLDNE